MRKPIFLLLIVAFCFACQEKEEKSLVSSSSDEFVEYPSFDEYFNSFENFSGNVLVATDGKPIFRKSYGYANMEHGIKNSIETKFRIGSITKQFTAMAIMILKEKGILNVNDDISKYLSDLPDAWQEITIHQLLTHTSGIMHSWELEGFTETMMLHKPVEEIIEQFKDQPLVGEPGEKHHYSGVGYFVLAEIIEQVSGKSYGSFLNDEIFDKLGMTNTGSDEPNIILKNRASGYFSDSIGTYNSTYIYMPILTGGGNLYSTLGDLQKWDKALYDNTLISTELKEIMFTVDLDDYAYGWNVWNLNSLYQISHSGSVPGFRALIDRYPEKHLLVLILSNNENITTQERRSFSKLVLEELE